MHNEAKRKAGSFLSGKEDAALGDGAGLFGPAPEHKTSLTPHDEKIPAFLIVPADSDHIPHLAAHMREADRREVWASHRHTPMEALNRSLSGSARAWTCFVADSTDDEARHGKREVLDWNKEGEGFTRGGWTLSSCPPRENKPDAVTAKNPRFSKPVCMWGVTRKGSILSDTGIPWLLGTPQIHAVERQFIRRSREYVEAMHRAGFVRLENYVHAGNTASLRWLAWCGFTIGAEVKFNGETFRHFWRVR